MTPSSQPRKKTNSSKVNLVISLAFHSVLVLAIVYFAAREGLIGKKLQTMAVNMVHKDKPPEKPKEPEKKPEPPKIEEPKSVKPVLSTPPPAAAPAVAATAPAAAPAASVDATSFFSGKEVITTSDPVTIYKNRLESALKTRWERPDGMDDSAYVAEVEVSVDSTGRISDPAWKQKSQNAKWDESVSKAIAATPSVNAPPPKGFPTRVIVKFDVVETEPLSLQ